MLAPPTQAIRYRPAVSDDCPHIVDLLNYATRLVRGDDVYALERLRQEWESPEFSLSDSTLVATTAGGRYVGYADVWEDAALPVIPFALAQVHPDYEGQGIGTRLMDWAEARARQCIERVPEHARVTLRAAAYHTHEPSIRLLKARGFAVMRHSLEMVKELSEPVAPAEWPTGVRFRRYGPHVPLRSVYDAWREAFRDHRGFVETDEDKGFERWQRRQQEQLQKAERLWYLALDGEKIAGVVMCSESPELGEGVIWMDILAVRRAWRRRGLGLALLLQSFHELREEGYRRCHLNVDGASLTGATRLYIRAGMAVMHDYLIMEKVLRPGQELTKQAPDE